MQAPCDFSGVRFIKVYINMNIHAIDSDGKDKKLVAIIPTVGTVALESKYLLGSACGYEDRSNPVRFDR